MRDFSATEQGRTVGRVCLCGVGSAGIKVMEEALTLAPAGVSVCAMNPDARSLNASTIPVKVHLGPHLTRGLGTGGDVKVGREAALESEAAIIRAVEGASLVVIAAGLGGGTGSGVAPEVARLAKECGACVVSVIIRPFRFEGERRLSTADEALRSLTLYSDIVLRFDNDAMEALIDADKGVTEAFSAVNALMARTVMIVPNLLESEGSLMQVGLDDLMTVVGSGHGICSFGMVTAAHDEEVSSVLTRLALSPLFFEKHLLESDDALVLIRGNANLSLGRMEELVKGVCNMLGSHVRLHIGLSVSKDACDETSITVLSVVPCEMTVPAPATVPLPMTVPSVTPEPPVPAPAEEPVVVQPDPVPVLDPEEPTPEKVKIIPETEEVSSSMLPPAPFLTDEDELEEVTTSETPAEPAPVVIEKAPEPHKTEPQIPSEPPAAEPEKVETDDDEEAPEPEPHSPEPPIIIPAISEGHPPSEGEEMSHLERGMFAGVSPILLDGEDLDLPPALRKKKTEQE